MLSRNRHHTKIWKKVEAITMLKNTQILNQKSLKKRKRNTERKNIKDPMIKENHNNLTSTNPVRGHLKIFKKINKIMMQIMIQEK